MSSLSNNIVTFLFCFIMLGFYLYYDKRISAAIAKASTGLPEFIAFLKNINHEELPYIFEEINQKAEDTVIANCWKGYMHGIIKNHDENGDTLFAKESADNYFDSEEILGKYLNVNYYGNAAGQFTGFGILGTFVGLTLGIAGILSNMDDMKQGIEVLLSGVNTAFLTSIVGIILSMCYTWRYKKKTYKLNEKVQEICLILDDLFPKKTTEMILYDQLLESKAQTIELKRFNDDIAITMANTFEEMLNNSFLRRIDENFEKTFSLLERVEEVVANQGAAISNEIKPLIGSLEVEIKKLTSKVGNELGDKIDNELGEQLAGFAKTLEGFTELMKNGLAEQDKANQNTLKLQEGLQEILKANTTDMVNAFKGAIAEFSNSLGVLQNHANQISEESVKAGIRNIENTEKMGKDAVTNIEKMIYSLDTTSEESVNRLRKVLDETEQTLSLSVKNIGDMLEKYSKMVNMAEQVLGAAEDTAASFSSAAGEVTKATNGVAQSVSVIGSQQKELQANLNDTIVSMKTLSNSTLETNRTTIEQLHTMKDVWELYRDAGKNLEEAFAVILKGLVECQNATGESLKTYKNELDKELSQSLESLAGIVDELNDNLDELKKIKK